MSELIGVLGAGTMGLGIARLCGQSGYSVLLYDSPSASAARARPASTRRCEMAARSGRRSAPGARCAGARTADWTRLCLEAVSEDLPLKQALFRDLDALLPEGAVLATNTSSFAVGSLAERLLRPDRVLGLHFFNPPYAMKLVEVVRSPKTSDRAFRKAWDLALALGRLPVEAKDTPGFIVNRVIRPFYLESQRAAAEGWGAYSAFDAALRAVEKLPMGPFELMDLIGLDVNLAISRSIYQSLGRVQRLEPNPIQERLVSMGQLGRKSGRGFYLYESGRPAGENPDACALLPMSSRIQLPRAICRRVLGAVAREAQRVFEEGVASEGIDMAVRMANFRRVPSSGRRIGDSRDYPGRCYANRKRKKERIDPSLAALRRLFPSDARFLA